MARPHWIFAVAATAVLATSEASAAESDPEQQPEIDAPAESVEAELNSDAPAGSDVSADTAPEAQPPVSAPAGRTLAAAPPGAQRAPSEAEPEKPAAAAESNGEPKLGTAATDDTGTWSLGGYGELIGSMAFYHPDVRTDDSGYRETRLDLARVSFFVGAKLSEQFSFTSEIEFEHGGTGVEKEIEWEEFGEYETEVEKGGEIVLEQAFLEMRASDVFALRAGHLLVPVGMTTLYHTPNLYSSAYRPESETHLIPVVWHESGLELEARFSDLQARAQVITGLDSTGFSSNRWIAGGTQRMFGSALANDWAAVLGVDYTGLPGTLVGVSGYTSNTTRNRPKRDMYEVSARAYVADVHLRLQLAGAKLRALGMLGKLDNAGAINQANASLSNALGAPRTPVGSAAYAFFVEAAYDVLHPMALRHRLDAFVRYDAYDTMWKAGAVDNPLMQRQLLTVGLNYFPHPRVVCKAEYVSRWLNEDREWNRRQSEINAALGFVL